MDSPEFSTRGGVASFGAVATEVMAAGRALGAIGPELAELSVRAGATLALEPAWLLAIQAGEVEWLGVRTQVAARRYSAQEEFIRPTLDAAQEVVADQVGWQVGVGIGVLSIPVRAIANHLPDDLLSNLIGASPSSSLPQAGDTSPGFLPDVVRGLIDRLLGENTWLLAAAYRALDSFVLGLAVAGGASQLQAAARSTGAPWPPRSSADGLAVLLSVAGEWGLLLDAPVAAVCPTRQPQPTARSSLHDLLAGAVALNDLNAIRITRVQVRNPTGENWAWIVQLPGTSSFNPHAGTNSADATTDAALLAGRTAYQSLAVMAALRAVQSSAQPPASAADSVLLVGHSLGGMTAANLAANPAFRRQHRRLSVLTAGAPVAHAAVPDSVQVMSLEHQGDLVPALDGAENPNRRNWLTVTAAARLGAATVTGPPAHDGARYVETAAAVDRAYVELPSAQSWKRTNAAAMQTGAATSWTYQLRRETTGLGERAVSASPWQTQPTPHPAAGRSAS